MNVFISYAREDAAFVHLLDYILNQQKMECFFDRKLKAGQEFTPEIQKSIAEADVLLVPWTQSASESNWVNQEIGFAVAKKIPIVPIVIDRDKIPRGMVESIQSYRLFDWSNSKMTVKGLIQAVKGSAQSRRGPYAEDDASLDLAIEGKVARTKTIIDILGKAAKEDGPLQIYCQAAFSTFAISNIDAYRQVSGHPKEYMDSLEKERKMFNRLLKQKHVELRMILWPVRAYSGKMLGMRFSNLLSWMEDVLHTPPKANIAFACSEYVGNNRLVIAGSRSNSVYFEGIKRKSTPGYEVNILSRKPVRIRRAITEFESVFSDAQKRGLVGEGAVVEVRRLMNKYLGITS